MIHIREKKNCCGCTACYNICPNKAIKMEADVEGFLYPEVNFGACINCGLCEAVCPVLHKVSNEEKTKGYIVRYNDEKIVKDSTSGGAFTAFATYLLEQGAVIYGAGYDESMHVICKKATRPEELKEMRGSKFVQSTLGSTFQDIKDTLKSGILVLFTGTPCQVAGLLSYLGKKADNLICIDFVCRGVPSPGLWANYVDMMEKKFEARMINARFKNKTYGYHATTMKIDFDNGKTWYGSGRIDPMMKAFVNELASRPSCHFCAFKGVERQSDLTIFDCYKFSNITGLKDDNKGYSSVLIHTVTGQSLLDSVSETLTVYVVDAEELVEKNGIMVRNSAKANPNREKLYELARMNSIEDAINIVSPIRFRDYVIEYSKKIFFMTGLIKMIDKIRKRKDVEI